MLLSVVGCGRGVCFGFLCVVWFDFVVLLGWLRI